MWGGTIMGNCPKCGKENKEHAKFCKGCGSDLKTKEIKEKDEWFKSKLKNKKPSIIIGIIIAVVIIYIATATETIDCNISEPYIDQEPYEEQEAYEEQIPYTVQVPYQYSLSYQVISRDCGKTGVVDVYAYCNIMLQNTDTESGYFTVTVTFETLNDGKVPKDQQKSILAYGAESFQFTYDVDAFEDVKYYSGVTPPTVTRYRTETQYRTETRYRTTTKYRDVTKYKTIQKSKKVNKFFGGC
ncbi:zinc ribbon domain-containing protein [Candidatus Woesearchaeota archaeon]|nr:zinc ribbon domain-containing protein [Candidatus Woesearchaeota archaeon]